LLKGVNDDPEVMKRLMQKLLKIRVKPYYLYQADLVTGTHQFRTSVETGLNILRALHGHTSGMAIPRYVIDAPGGGGKITLVPPEFVLEMNPREVILKNYEDRVYRYPQVSGGPPQDHYAPCGEAKPSESEPRRPISLQRFPR